MLSAIRKRLTYGNVAMTVALVFAMSGGAFAAGKILITSTKQISPKVLKSLQGKAGPAGAAGAQGPAGPAGPQGPAGLGGAPGAKGETGPEGKEGKAGKDGKNGTTGFTETLPEGKTEEGTWSTTFSPQAEGLFSLGTLSASFNIPLAAALSTEGCVGGSGTSPATCKIHFINHKGKELREGAGGLEEAPASASCPGEGQAAVGNLCVYEVSNGTVISGGLGITLSSPGGVVITFANPPKSEMGADSGTWAVTAP